LPCKAVAAWLAGMEADAPGSVLLEAEVLSGLTEFEQDRATQVVALAFLGSAALTRDDFAQAERLFLRVRHIGHDAVYEARLLYELAQCRRQQGDDAGARALFQEAAATGLDTHYARLACKMLEDAPDGQS